MKGIEITLRATALILLVVTAQVGRAEDRSTLLMRASQSVVSVKAYSKHGARVSRGSGFVVTRDGIVATTLRVVQLGDVIELETLDGEVRYATSVLRTDADWDVALLQSEPFSGPALRLAPEKLPTVGLEIVAIGSTSGDGLAAAEGIVVGVRAHKGHGDLMLISSQISTQSNGGPVVKRDGEVIGVARSTTRGDRRANFAVPTRVIHELLAISPDVPPERELVVLSSELREGQSVLENLRANLEQQCASADVGLIDRVLSETISSGAVIYDIGDPLGCYRLYDAASYKLLYLLEDRCGPASSVLQQAVADAGSMQDPGRYSSVPAARAWLMRHAFNSLLGVSR